MKDKTALKRAIAELVLSEIESHTQAGISPVTGNKFRKLSSDYQKFKKSQGKGTEADLHLHDTMINSIKAGFTSTGVNFTITDSLEKKKAYNHNVGDTLPKRPFIPDDTSDSTRFNSFTGKIKEAIREAIREVSSDNKES